jgi:hypothetical protein
VFFSDTNVLACFAEKTDQSAKIDAFGNTATPTPLLLPKKSHGKDRSIVLHLIHR